LRSRRRILARSWPRLAKEHLPASSPCLEGDLVLLLDGGEEKTGEEGGVKFVGMGFLEEADELLGMLGSELDLLLVQGGELASDVTDGHHRWVSWCRLPEPGLAKPSGAATRAVGKGGILVLPVSASVSEPKEQQRSPRRGTSGLVRAGARRARLYVVFGLWPATCAG
jgi:hypothetical protein